MKSTMTDEDGRLGPLQLLTAGAIAGQNMTLAWTLWSWPSPVSVKDMCLRVWIDVCFALVLEFIPFRIVLFSASWLIWRLFPQKMLCIFRIDNHFWLWPVRVTVFFNLVFKHFLIMSVHFFCGHSNCHMSHSTLKIKHNNTNVMQR